jgi:poly(3-hydroxybutyrate) depolymerase
MPRNRNISLEKGILTFNLPVAAPVMVEIFDVRGTLIKRDLQPDVPAGYYRFNVADYARAARLLLVNATIGGEGLTFRYMPLHNGKYVIADVTLPGTTGDHRLAKVTAVDDTVKVTAQNYREKAVAITSYDQILDITLDTAGGSDDPKPSSGCGKEPPLSGQKRFTINVSAAGAGNRDYILRLPDDYDKDHPCPLFFGIHCMNGTADNVANSEPDTKAEYEYFGMWKFANPTGGKGTTVFCAPQGIGNAWGQGAKDLAFFRAMIKKFEEELCIDQSRIFAMGFSMGGSMSYALACAMPDTMRAIGMLAGGSMSGCDGTHRGPVPIFIAHGTSDPTCRWPGSGYSQIKDLANRCGCDPMDIPALVNQNPPADKMHPVCFEYKNCDDGMPCRACIHKGDHTGSPGTEGQWGKNNTWTDDSAWSYFKRFY